MSYVDHMKKVSPDIIKLAQETAKKLRTLCNENDEENVRISYPLIEKSFQDQLAYEMVLLMRKELRNHTQKDTDNIW